MKFELFGKLKDKDNEEKAQGRDSGFEGSESVSDFSSGGVQRTVENLFEQGYSEEEVRNELEGQYSRDQIQGAINEAVKTSATSETDGPEPMTPYRENDNNNMNEQDEMQSNENQAPVNPSQEMQNPPLETGSNPSPQRERRDQQNDVEELIETIVAENFERVEVEFENVYSEIDELKEMMEELDDRVHDLEVRDDEDDKQVIQKMDDIENDINEYQSRIGGLEKAFQQVLPSLVDNVRDLTSLVQEIKQERGIETSSTVDEDSIDDIDMEDW